MKRGSLRLYGPVGEMFGAGSITASGVAADLDKLKAQGVKALDIYLSSDGGMVGDGLAIYAQIQRFPGEVDIHVDGRAVSIASVIALAGRRLLMSRASMLMIHSPMLPAVMANARAMRKMADDLDEMGATMRGIYASASGLSPERITEIMDAETWMTAQKAVELGFADGIIEDQQRARASLPDIATSPDLLAGYRNTPAELRGMRAEAALAKLEGLLMRQRMQEIACSASAAAAGPTPGAVNRK